MSIETRRTIVLKDGTRKPLPLDKGDKVFHVKVEIARVEDSTGMPYSTNTYGKVIDFHISGVDATCGGFIVDNRNMQHPGAPDPRDQIIETMTNMLQELGVKFED
mgnify:CR=1 FL=1